VISVQVMLECTSDEDRDRLAKIIRLIDPYALITDSKTGEELEADG
jgi:hypothetical protein